ncbi:hypothetical protein H6P81_010534 [Aristolochia fimbriata]|uniref:Uncharacterized protein n=1 Tax=Aristolochia fimbriata TaxID=158543 RepID=A0AAV7EPR6_ARIFI|nr:hypothetical protein H6P81_010534 [Aristolochia fimbriata]
MEVASALTQPEVAPSSPFVQETAEEEVVETPAPTEEVVEVEAPTAQEVQEEAPVAVEEIPAVGSAVEVVEEVPTAMEEVADDAPAVEEASIVQDLATPIPTSQEASSQEFLSYVEGLMLQAWKDRIAPRMLSPGALQTLKEIKSSAREKASRTSRDQAESIARKTLAIVSSKLEEAKTTLGEVTEELSEAKAEEENAREHMELAREQLQSAGTKVAYLTTQAEQIQESVRGLKMGVVEAEQLIAEVIATPTLCAVEEETLLSSRAAFAELQQEMARNL